MAAGKGGTNSGARQKLAGYPFGSASVLRILRAQGAVSQPASQPLPAFSLEKGDIADLTVPDNGFIEGEKLEEYVNKAVRNTPLEKMRIPFYTVATDIGSEQEFVFGSGNAGNPCARAVRSRERNK